MHPYKTFWYFFFTTNLDAYKGSKLNSFRLVKMDARASKMEYLTNFYLYLYNIIIYKYMDGVKHVSWITYQYP